MKNQKGITLIALVITIIVLLILAGITIAMLTGENGLLGRSQQASMDNAIAGAKDRISTEVQAGMATYLEKKYADITKSYTGLAPNEILTQLKTIWNLDASTPITDKDLNGCKVSVTVSTENSVTTGEITIVKETRKVKGTIKADGTLEWGDIYTPTTANP